MHMYFYEYKQKCYIEKCLLIGKLRVVMRCEHDVSCFCFAHLLFLFSFEKKRKSKLFKVLANLVYTAKLFTAVFKVNLVRAFLSYLVCFQTFFMCIYLRIHQIPRFKHFM